MTTRRNVLTILGLAGVATPAIATDDLVRTEMDGGPFAYRLGAYDPERMAVALERLAAEVRNKTVNIARFHIASEIKTDEWLKQTLTVDVEIMHPDAA